jgi:hypothetical protein
MRRILACTTGRARTCRRAFACVLAASISLLLVAKQSGHDFTNNYVHRQLSDEFMIEHIANALTTVHSTHTGCGNDDLRSVGVLFPNMSSNLLFFTNLSSLSSISTFPPFASLVGRCVMCHQIQKSVSQFKQNTTKFFVLVKILCQNMQSTRRGIDLSLTYHRVKCTTRRKITTICRQF